MQDFKLYLGNPMKIALLKHNHCMIPIILNPSYIRLHIECWTMILKDDAALRDPSGTKEWLTF